LRQVAHCLFQYKMAVMTCCIEAISKPRIRSESKAQADEKAQHTREYVSILKRLATQLSGLRRGFEMASRQICRSWLGG